MGRCPDTDIDLGFVYFDFILVMLSRNVSKDW